MTDRLSIPAVQARTNRHFVLLEQEPGIPYRAENAVATPCCVLDTSLRGRLVLHDANGESDPRVVYPQGAEPVGLGLAAAREEDGVATILISTSDANAPTAPAAFRLKLSTDGGASWRGVELPAALTAPWTMTEPLDVDRGGPFCRSRAGHVAIGSRDVPFVLVLSGAGSRSVVAGILPDGTVRFLLEGVPGALHVIGANAEGTRHLVYAANGQSSSFWTVSLDGVARKLFDSYDAPYGWTPSGFLTPAGDAYVEMRYNFDRFFPTLLFYQASDSAVSELAIVGLGETLFAIPTRDFGGAWILRRTFGGTTLSRHRPGGVLEEMWRDITRLEVEALHAAWGTDRLLVQLHRPRPAERSFVDPALAIWEPGQPAPRDYHELFLNEEGSKGFVHLDVDELAEGGEFVFDSGLRAIRYPPGGGPSGGGGGGSDVVQEWGVVRGSLRQRLLVPGVARTDGARESRWATDLAIRNPDATKQRVTLRFLPLTGTRTWQATIQLAPREIRRYTDVLASLFGLETNAGALLLLPETSVQATSRTYTSQPGKSYGTAVPPMDFYSVTSPRFPFSFAAALPGDGYRTNLLFTQLAGRPSEVSLGLHAPAPRSASSVSLSDATGGHSQLTDLAGVLGAPRGESGSLLFQPSSGTLHASLVVIDDVTNDPTFFGPDLPAPVARTIPAIVHKAGANGVSWASDLHLVNVSDETRAVRLGARRWDVLDSDAFVWITLRPRESKTVRDALRTLFAKEGVARLRFASFRDGFSGASDGVRVTSRTYAAGPDGGTYGLPVPPLNAFQAAASGETLEILMMAPPPLPGIGGERWYRTNLALVDLTEEGGTTWRVHVEVLDGAGRAIDAFDVDVRNGGLQLDDVFHARGLGDGPPAALIRVTPYGGLVAAYATVIDAGTNDPTYFGANLAAR